MVLVSANTAWLGCRQSTWYSCDSTSRSCSFHVVLWGVILKNHPPKGRKFSAGEREGSFQNTKTLLSVLKMNRRKEQWLLDAKMWHLKVLGKMPDWQLQLYPPRVKMKVQAQADRGPTFLNVHQRHGKFIGLPGQHVLPFWAAGRKGLVPRIYPVLSWKSEPQAALCEIQSLY